MNSSHRLSRCTVAACMLVASVALSTRSQAFTATASNVLLSGGGPEAVVVDSLGTPVPVGMGVVGIGYFVTLSDATIAAMDAGGTSFANPGLLAADFALFGLAVGPATPTSPVNGGGFGLPGLLSIDFVAPVVPLNASFVGKSMYVMIGNALTFAASTDFIVYKDASAFAADPAPGATALINSTGIPPDALLVGTYPGPIADYYGFGPLAAFQLADVTGIPEPSRLILAVMGIAVCGLRRRR